MAQMITLSLTGDVMTAWVRVLSNNFLFVPHISCKFKTVDI